MSSKGKTSEKNATDEPKKGASDPEPKGGKGDAHELDMGVGIPNKGGSARDGAGDADSFVQDQAGGLDRPGTDSSDAGAITDRFGGGGDRTDGVGDLLNPGVPSSGAGTTPGTAGWQDGPTDPSGGPTTGTDVANVSDWKYDNSDRRFDYNEAVTEYEKTDQTWDDYNELHDKLDDIDDANPIQTGIAEFAHGERVRATEPPPEEPLAEQPLAALDATEVSEHIGVSNDGEVYFDSREGSLVRNDDSGNQSVAPGTADGVYLEQDEQMSTETVIVAQDDGLAEFGVNPQSYEDDVTYGYDKNGDYFVVDGNNNATAIDSDDIPPGTRVRDLDNSLGDDGEGDYHQSEKTDDGQQDGTDSEDNSNQDADDQASDEQAEQDSDDGAEEGSDASTPSGEATGAERAAQAEDLRQQGYGELVDRRDASGDAIDPGDIDTVEGGSGQPTDDGGISNPEGTTPVSGSGRAPGDPGNIDYGEDDNRQYDGREQSPADEVSVQHSSGLEGYAPGSDDSEGGITTLDPGDIDMGPPSVSEVTVPGTTNETVDLPIEFGGGTTTEPNDLFDATDYGRGDPAPVEAIEDDPVMSDDTEVPVEDPPADQFNAPEQEDDAHDTPYEEEPAAFEDSSETEDTDETDDVMMD